MEKKHIVERFNVLKRAWPSQIRYQLVCGVVLVQLVLLALFAFILFESHRDFLALQNLKETQVHLKALEVASILYTLAAILAGSVLVVFIGNRLTSGLNKLLVLSSQIRDGRRDLRMETSGNDEISRLGEGINQMLEAVKASEMRARVLVERAHDAIVVTDVDLNRFVDANPNAERLFGCSREELLISSPGRFYSPEQPQGRSVEEMIRENTEAVLRGEEVVCERSIRNAEGKDLVCELHLVQLPSENRKLIRCSYLDVTERKRAEADLIQRAHQLELLSNAGLLINTVLETPMVLRQLVAMALKITGAEGGTDAQLVDGKMVFKEYNQSGKIIAVDYQFGLGYGVPGWVMQTRAPYVSNDAEHDPHVIPDIQKKLAFYNLADTPIISSQGELLGCFEIHNKPGGFNEIDMLLLQNLAASASIALENAKILDERKRAEEALRESEERFKRLMEQSPLSIQIFDPQGRAIQVNKAFEDMWGIFLADLTNYNVLEDKQLEKIGLMPYLRRGFAGEATSIPCVEYDTKSTLKKGHKCFVQGYIYPVKDEQGNVRNVILTHEDISERMRREEALKQAKEAAEAANRAKDQFIAVLSHELRTPLTPVLATVAALGATAHLSAELRAEMEMIQRNVELEAKLIDDLLDVTRISQGKIELRRETVDAYACLQNALEICKGEIGLKNLDVSLHLAAERHLVWADASRLQQVFWNLLKNAVKFTPEAGLISIRSSNVGERLRIEITDTGIGLAPELLPRIFNAFEQGEQTKTRHFGGLGLGLSIAKAVVELHDGSITCKSEGPGRGTTFTVELAAIASPPVPKISAPLSAPLKDKRWKVLLVDDHPDTLRILSLLLQKCGYTVASADCVRTALEWMEKERFDLLLSDIGLPDGSGLDIMRQAKKLYALHGIAISGFGTEEDIRQSREAGFEEHIIKPLRFDTLRETIQRVMSNPA